MTTMDIIFVALAVVLLLIMVILGIQANKTVNKMTDEEWLEHINDEYNWGHDVRHDTDKWIEL